MLSRAIVDTGFLVALLDANDDHHAWAKDIFPRLRGPWCTAEACITEVLFILERAPKRRSGIEELLSWIEDGVLISKHLLPEELEHVRSELLRYEDRWVDFADACIVCLSDQDPTLPVVSVDANDFAVYFRRRAGRRVLVPTTKRRKR